jgi:peptidylprolyl isomerase/peptidyl-prolyl cis-trans isomerase B (cyclophilin B)
MVRFFAAAVMVVFVLVFLGCSEGKKVSSEKEKEQVAVIETDFGKIVFKLYFSDAPKTCENFIKLAKSGFYNNLTFHRILPGFVIQGGSVNGDGTGGPGYFIKAEFNSRKHTLGTVAMARMGGNPDSADCQFYICLADRPDLDGNYTVFGQVIEGIDAVRRIAQVETTGELDPYGHPLGRPKNPVYIRKVYIEEREVPK